MNEENSSAKVREHQDNPSYLFIELLVRCFHSNLEGNIVTITISRTRISRILRNSISQSELKIHFDCFLQSKLGDGNCFTSPNYPKCKL